MSGYELTEPNYVQLKEHVITQLSALDPKKYGGKKPNIDLNLYFDRFKKNIDKLYIANELEDEFLMNKLLIMVSTLLDKLLANTDAKKTLEKEVGQHRLFAALVSLSIKYLIDDNPKNSWLSQVAGMPLVQQVPEELNDIEFKVFKLSGFNLSDIRDAVTAKQQQIFGQVLYNGEFINDKLGEYKEPPLPVSVEKGSAAFATQNNAAASAVSNAAAASSAKPSTLYGFASSIKTSIYKRLFEKNGSKKITEEKPGIASLVQPVPDSKEEGSPKKMAGQKTVVQEEEEPDSIQRPGAPGPGTP